MDKFLKHKLYFPSLEEVAGVLEKGLQETFTSVSVRVVECPNLKEKPFMLASEGLSGKTALADVGGVPYLVPLAQKDKIYDMKKIAQKIGTPNAFIIGAGAGPRHHIGTNCEMMANIKLDPEFNNTHIAKIGKEKDYELIQLKDSSEFCLLGNLFISEGKPGKVIQVLAQKRKGPENFVSAMRKVLAKEYGVKPVGMGGVFVIKSGKAKLHIMPDYSEKPLNSDDDVNNWLKFFDLPAPLSCLSTFVSCDPGLDLRIEHTHCFSDHGVGGHYHEDTTPDCVDYEGYFNVADFMYRFDPPSVTHQIGRD
ncbi:ester hydrolase C11orf54-like [Uloborus diversus]|uniref:ester hydrolase C11orf54-like n=1 Tax=Uloborus diversus TaxID=327109 RepID=UPI0024091231|nr:ester hydrolase C11orf54-like [Uloborus diversus]